MKILIFGVSGLIGHNMFRVLSNYFYVYGTLHHKKINYNNKLFENDNIIEDIDIKDFINIESILNKINPDVVLNCVGLTKRKINLNSPYEPILINSLFPNFLSSWALKFNKRLIQFSTDCVFNGKQGNYTENSLTDAEDLYGRTKALGEIKQQNCLTIRSSFIGEELYDKTELLNWIISQKGQTVTGYRNTYYSGVSTHYLTKFIQSIIIDFPNLYGLYNLAPIKPISKYDLISLANKEYGLNLKIIPDELKIHNPTLNGNLLRNITKLEIPTWDIMMKDLASHHNLYI